MSGIDAQVPADARDQSSKMVLLALGELASIQIEIFALMFKVPFLHELSSVAKTDFHSRLTALHERARSILVWVTEQTKE